MEIGFRFFPIIVGIIVKYEILRHGQAHIGSLTQSKKVAGIVSFCTISRAYSPAVSTMKRILGVRSATTKT